MQKNSFEKIFLDKYFLKIIFFSKKDPNLVVNIGWEYYYSMFGTYLNPF